MADIEVYGEGAKRENGVPEYWRLTSEFVRRTAQRATEGSIKYPDHEDGIENWKHGDREWAKSAFNHVLQHLLTWKEAEDFPDGEDHLAAAAWGIMALMFYETRGDWNPYADEIERTEREYEDAFPPDDSPEDFGLPPVDDEAGKREFIKQLDGMSVQDRLRLLFKMPPVDGGK